MDRRAIGIEIQKANIHTTYITVQSFYLEKYWGSNGFNPEIVGQSIHQIQEARLNCGRRLLDVMTVTPRELLDACAFSFCMQVRAVAGPLVSSPLGRDYDSAKIEQDEELKKGKEEAQAYAADFLKVLVTFEKMGGRRSSGQEGVDVDEEVGAPLLLREPIADGNHQEELRVWAAKGGNQDGSPRMSDGVKRE